ncbi:MAG: SGNH/GDSL hydrolase family protein [Clostridia bacterium]|nr:SGNH/GDSL hydrolase family protein [Clostridia bacterium]
MKIKEKLMMEVEGLMEHGPVNIVVLGDSVTHGVVGYEIDYEAVWWNLLRRKLNGYRNYVPVNIIDAGIDGTTAKDALPRLDGQALVHRPDLVIVCFGLNDVHGELDDYVSALRTIFGKCRAAGLDVIFMTPNMLNTRVAEDVRPNLAEFAVKTAELQNSGKMDAFMDAARAVAREAGVTVCDCYAEWKKLAETEDVTMLLGNRINHPDPERQHLFADMLYEMIMGE